MGLEGYHSPDADQTTPPVDLLPEHDEIVDQTHDALDDLGTEIAHETTEIPAEFLELNQYLNLSTEALADYFLAYEQTPKTKKIPLKEIEKHLKYINDIFPKSLQADKSLSTIAIDNLLLETFTSLINGDKDKVWQIRKVLDNPIFRQRLTESNRAIEQIKKKIQSLHKKLEAQNKILKMAQDTLAQNVGGNANWYQRALEISKSTNDPQISSNIKTIRATQTQIQNIIQQISLEEGNLQKTMQGVLLNQYKLMRNSGLNTDNFLLSLFDSNIIVPRELQSEMEAAKKRRASAPGNLFDQAFYSGNYSDALRLALNAARDRGHITDAPIPAEHRDNFEPGLTASGITEQEILILATDLDKHSLKKNIFKPGTKTHQTYEEGYSYIPAVEAGTVHIFIKKDPDGTVSYRIFDFEDNILSERTIKKTEQQKLNIDENKKTENIRKALAKQPTINKILKAGKTFQEKLTPLQNLFQAGLEGKKTTDFVDLARQYATDLKANINLEELRAACSELKPLLAELRQLPSGEIESSLEKEIRQLEEALTQTVQLIETDQITHLCDTILNRAKFNEDTWKTWLINEGIIFISAILVAVGTIVTITTFWTGIGGIGGLALVSAAGALGGMAGAELGHIISHEVGQSVYGEENYDNKSLLGQYWQNEKLYNPETQQYEDIGLDELGKVYGTQFVISFVTTFAALGAGRIAGKFLAKNIDKWLKMAGFRKALAEMLQKIPKMTPELTAKAEQTGIKSFMERLGKECFEEIGEEGFETSAEKIHPLLGFIATVYNCLDGQLIEDKFSQFGLTKSETAIPPTPHGSSDTVLHVFEYARGSDFLQLLGHIKENFPDYKPFFAGNGTIGMSLELEHDGQKLTNTIFFQPSKHREPIRKLLNSDSLPHDIENIFGITQIENTDTNYTYTTAATESIYLIDIFKENGFVIIGDPSSGQFKIRKGEETFNFYQSATETELEIAEAKSAELIRKLGEVDKSAAQLENLLMERVNYRFRSQTETDELLNELESIVSEAEIHLLAIKSQPKFQKITLSENTWALSSKVYTAKGLIKIKHQDHIIEETIQPVEKDTIRTTINKHIQERKLDRKDKDNPARIKALQAMRKQKLIRHTIKMRRGEKLNFVLTEEQSAAFQQILPDIEKIESTLFANFYQNNPYESIPSFAYVNIVLVPDANVRSYASGESDILLRSSELFQLDENGVIDEHTKLSFLSTYAHERTHTIANKMAWRHPEDNGIVEGIAQYTEFQTMLDLFPNVLKTQGFGENLSTTADITRIGARISQNYQGGDIMDYLDNYIRESHSKMDSHDFQLLSYEYGQAFAASCISKIGFPRFLSLYKHMARWKINPQKNFSPADTVGHWLQALQEIGIEEQIAQEIIFDTGQLLILEGRHSLGALHSLIASKSPENISTILEYVDLRTLFNIDSSQPDSVVIQQCQQAIHDCQIEAENSPALAEHAFLVRNILQSKLNLFLDPHIKKIDEIIINNTGKPNDPDIDDSTLDLILQAEVPKMVLIRFDIARKHIQELINKKPIATRVGNHLLTVLEARKKQLINI